MSYRLVFLLFLVALVPGLLGTIAGAGLYLHAPRLFWASTAITAAWFAGLVAFEHRLRLLVQER